MKKDRTERIIEAIVILAFGILVAIFGEKSIDIYLGVSCVIAGIGLLVLAALGFKSTRVIPFATTFGGLALLTIGICALVGFAVSFRVLIGFVLLAIGALGLTMIIHGAWLTARKLLFTGIGEIVVGVLAIVFVILYFTVDKFAGIAWIFIGVAIAIYGLLELINVLIEKKK